jgi:hypothetical protein
MCVLLVKDTKLQILSLVKKKTSISMLSDQGIQIGKKTTS